MIKPKKSIENISCIKNDSSEKNWRLKLNSNENIYGCNPNLLSIIKNIKNEDICLYPNYEKLLNKLSQKYELDNNNFLLTNGSSEAINVIINTYLDKNDELIVINPTISIPKQCAEIIGANIIQVDYEKKFIFPAENLKKSITEKTKIIYLASPNNPTGEIIEPEVLYNLLEEYKNILFILDCTYINFASDGNIYNKYKTFAKKFDNLIIIKSYSKDFAIAGLRFGVCVADKTIINNLKKVILPYSVNSVAVHCAICLLNEEEQFEKNKDLNINAKDLFIKKLSDFGYIPYPSEGNYILCDFKEHCNFYYDKFKKNDVIVKKYPNSSVSTCLRLTVPTIGGIKYILNLINKKKMLVFSLDNVIFDVTRSYILSVAETFKHFTGKNIEYDEIKETKNLGGMNCYWNMTKYLLNKYNYNVSLEDIINIFQNTITDYIDHTKLLISKDTLEKLNEEYDLVIFSGHLKDEVSYLLSKYEIDKYFYYYVTSDDLPKNMLKPNPKGILEILKHCPHLSIRYLCGSVDDVISGKSANTETIGIITKDDNYNLMVNNYRHLCTSYILDNIDNINNFLNDIENNKISSCM